MSITKEQFIEMLEGLSDNEVLTLKNLLMKYKDYRETLKYSNEQIVKYKKDYEKYKYKFIDKGDIDE